MAANGLPRCLICGDDCAIYHHPGGRRCLCVEQFMHPVARATLKAPHYYIICAKLCSHCDEIHEHVRGMFPVEESPALSRELTPGFPKAPTGSEGHN